MIRNPLRRRVARDLTRALALMSAVMLVIAVGTAITSGSSPASAATDSGSVGFTPSNGGSATSFSLTLPSGAACTGDSAGANYRVQTYLIPAAADPSGLTFDGSGPIQVSGQVRSPLYSANGEPVVGALTGSAATPGGPGVISGLPTMSFGVLLPGDLAAGTYNVGVACTVGQAGSKQLDKFWNAHLTVTADSADAPAQFTWVLAATGTTTTTVGGTTSTTAGGTTTTTGDGTTTTTDGSTTTTDGSTTTTGGADVSGADAFSGGSPSAASPVTTMGQLPYTGSSPLPMVFWAIALLVFGRIAMLLGKRPKVVGNDPPE
jgi:hypothetical protein